MEVGIVEKCSATHTPETFVGNMYILYYVRCKMPFT